MYKIVFPEGRKFNGVYLSVKFNSGEGETESAYLADRFKAKGQSVKKEPAKKAESNDK